MPEPATGRPDIGSRAGLATAGAPGADLWFRLASDNLGPAAVELHQARLQAQAERLLGTGAGMQKLIDTFFNAEVFVSAMPLLLRGVVNTILLGVTAIVIGSIAGVILALLRLYAWRTVRLLTILYIDVLRALPTLVVIVIVYFALPFIGITLSSFAAATLALSMVLAAYTAEVVRAGIEAIPKGQFEAAQALGLRFMVVLRKVILPQALRIVIPPTTSNFILAMKETSLASTVATPDLLKMALDTQALYANPTPLIGAALLYLVLLGPMVRLVSYLELRSSAPAR